MSDLELVCRDCGASFVFTEAEQAFFAGQGFTNPPKRCKACRAKARQRGAGHGPAARSASRRSPEAPRAVQGSRTGTQPAAAAMRDAQPAAPSAAAPAARVATAETCDPAFATHFRPPEAAVISADPSSAAGSGAAATREPRRPRGPMHTTVCSICGAPTEVPFVPDGVRPVYCLPCLKKQTR